MRTVVIGGTGHVGTYLVPRLVELGHDVVSISRGRRSPYRQHEAWSAVRQVQSDRKAEDQAGAFATKVRELAPDIVIDLICFTPQSARMLVEVLRGQVQHFLHCGTLWVHGHSTVVPVTEDEPRTEPLEEYGKQKVLIEAYLLDEARRRGFPATVLHPGHIVGTGWRPINPAGNLDVEVFARLARGDQLALPNLGLETLHHVHADDVAQAFVKAITHRSVAVGESFHAVSPAAVTMRGYAEAAAGWFAKKANLSFLPWEQWKTTVSEQDASLSWGHVARSSNCSIAKARRLLEYEPRYTSLQAVRQAVDWLIEQGELRI